MTRGLLVLATLVTVGAVVAPAGSPSSTAGRHLVGTIGPGFTIHLTQHGQPVESLRPGTYWLTVTDPSTIHNYHVLRTDQPGLDEVVTSVAFTGTTTVKLHLEHGDYTFQCDPHKATMHGNFTVGGVGQTDTP
jgi:hypothetical protein